jgi:hypothetical protein
MMGAVLSLLSVLAVACRSLGPLPPANVSEPGWTVRQGQAVWQRGRDAPELVGDLTVGTRGGSEGFVQFSKGPFPILVAQVGPGVWEVHAPAENKRYAGRGEAPGRVAFLALLRAVLGQTPPSGWWWQPQAEGRWRLENRRKGEWLEGYLRPQAIPQSPH